MSEPYLPDPYFRRTVVLLCDHNDEGSFGFVLNRHTDMAVNDLMENMPPIGSQVGIGGPVQSSNLYYLHTLGKRIIGSEEIIDGVFMGGDYDQLRGVLKADEKLTKHVRFFVGYSGWDKDQLDKELSEKSWLVALARTRSGIMDVRTTDIWVRRCVPWEELRATGEFPEDPSLN